MTVDFAFDDMRESGMKLIPFSDGIYEWKACMITRRDEEENEAEAMFQTAYPGLDRQDQIGARL